MAISKVQLPDNSKQDIHDARISDISSTYPKFYVGTCSTAAATAAKVVTVEAFPTVNGAPVIGTVIAVKFDKTNSATAPTLNVNGLGAESIYANTSVVSSTSANYGGTAGRYIYYMWDGTYWCWLNHGVDNDTNTVAYIVRYQNASKPLSGHLARYRLLFTSADGTKWVPSNTETSTDAASSKTVNQTPIDPFGPIVYYGSTTIIEADGIAAASALYIQQGITFGHSFNVTNAALTLTANAPVYIKCAPQSNGSAIIDSTTPYVQSLPSTADGKIYIYLGQAYGATTVELSIAHPVYYYADGQIRLWTNAASGGGEANVIEGITFNGTAVTVTNKVAAIYGADTELAPAGGADLVRAAGLSDYVNSTTFALPNSDADGYCDYTIATTDDIPTKTSDLTNDSGFLTSESSLSLSTSGSGNAITALSVNGHAITATKGTTFSTTDKNLQTSDIDSLYVSSSRTFYPILDTGASTGTKSLDTYGIKFVLPSSRVEEPTQAILVLGNGDVYGNGRTNKNGILRIYNINNKYVDLKYPTSLSSNISVELPSSAGTLALISDIPTVPTKTSDLTNDSGFLTSYTETDPTVPSWAKESSKPSYTASEVGAVPTTRTVNGKALSSDITLTASDVSALPSSTSIPTKTSDLTNDSNFQYLAYTAISSASSSTTLAWNTVYQWTVNPTSISLTLPSAPTDSRGEIVLKFTTGSTAPTVTWPSGLKWANGEEITPEASTTYEFSIGYDMMGGFTILGCGFTSAS